MMTLLVVCLSGEAWEDFFFFFVFFFFFPLVASSRIFFKSFLSFKIFSAGLSESSDSEVDELEDESLLDEELLSFFFFFLDLGFDFFSCVLITFFLSSSRVLKSPTARCFSFLTFPLCSPEDFERLLFLFSLPLLSNASFSSLFLSNSLFLSISLFSSSSRLFSSSSFSLFRRFSSSARFLFSRSSLSRSSILFFSLLLSSSILLISSNFLLISLPLSIVSLSSFSFIILFF